MSTVLQKRNVKAVSNTGRKSTMAATIYRPLSVDNLRDELWRTIQDARTGAISIVNAAVIARLAHELMKTYRVIPEVEGEVLSSTD